MNVRPRQLSALLSLFALVVCLAWPGAASAQTCMSLLFPNANANNQISCTRHQDCQAGFACRDQICVDEKLRSGSDRTSASAQQGTSSAQVLDESADDQCGLDRRCRIERIKARSRLNRRVAVLKEEKYVEDLAQFYNERRIEQIPRLSDPWGLDVKLSMLGYGAVAGYTFAGLLRVETTFLYHDEYIYQYSDTELIGIEGYHEAYFLGASATVFPMESWFSPYLSAGVMAGWGSFGQDYYGYGGGYGSQSLSTEYHVVRGAAGIDMQFEFGGHTRLGFEYGYLVYNQARYAAGNYNPETRRGLNQWMSSEALWGVEWLFGWAF
ncbi:MAG: hypothetical protein H0U74_17220 [Bradymonadaceae bacterium]|nr:hypothetical protein [Lujinxingiaceae bacterium]